MGTTKRFAIGLGLAGGAALLTAWLLSGSRGQKTKNFLVQKAQDLKKYLKKEIDSNDENEVHHI